MEQQWRVFIAIPLPEEVKKWIQVRMNSFVIPTNQLFKRITDPRDYHITVQFLGDVEISRIAEIEARMQLAVQRLSPFWLQLSEWDTFGRRDAPKVLWYGTQGNLQVLTELHHHVTAQMHMSGFLPEDRAYHPHITTARQYRGEGEFDLIGMERVITGGGHDEDLVLTLSRPEWQVDRIVLYRTRMGQRPMYEVVAEALLAP
ncbi:RNA 2',3'-cyclic phosphodiesterase [Paenibacillus sp. ACRRX]|uniref:RNA 2',3'-cyclic phosphodiesterase n=1 Tax=Paenibacillus sp. ACRRX TaxID=2918206 RepID=UPI001EF3E989|nr:RNA 2',3'-cyclic phosphodiesterase [Paenibacillus sp. ACRRX]